MQWWATATRPKEMYEFYPNTYRHCLFVWNVLCHWRLSLLHNRKQARVAEQVLAGKWVLCLVQTSQTLTTPILEQDWIYEMANLEFWTSRMVEGWFPWLCLFFGRCWTIWVSRSCWYCHQCQHVSQIAKWSHDAGFQKALNPANGLLVLLKWKTWNGADI